MDIKAPSRVASSEPVKTAPPESGDPMPDSVDLKKANKKGPKPPKMPKPPGVGVGLAITATVVIVLGLGSLFVYAYLQTAK